MKVHDRCNYGQEIDFFKKAIESYNLNLFEIFHEHIELICQPFHNSLSSLNYTTSVYFSLLKEAHFIIFKTFNTDFANDEIKFEVVRSLHLYLTHL